jgi:hypothetical protein
MLRKGVPDEAYKPLTGDDKEAAKAYAKFNKQQREGKGATGFLANLKPPADLIDAARALADMPQDTLECEAVSVRAAAYGPQLAEPENRQRLLCRCLLRAEIR